jgi:hypothetical protein
MEVLLNNNRNTFYWKTQKYTIFWYMYCLRQQKATYLMKNKHETCVAIYWNLSHNAISVIKYNTFNNLPNLICIWVSFCIIDWKVCSLYDNICIRKCFFLYKTSCWQMCTPNSTDMSSIRNFNLVVGRVWRYQRVNKNQFLVLRILSFFVLDKIS